MKLKSKLMKRLALVPALLLAAPAVAGAGTGSGAKFAPPMEDPVAAEPASLCDQIFGIPTLYRNPDNPYIQRFAIRGRYQGQYHYTDADTGTSEDWENRRIRFGADLDFLRDFSFETRFNIKRSSGGGRLFEDVYTMSVTWKLSPDVSLQVGKQKPLVTQEWRTSSAAILTFERSLLVNTVIPDPIWGARVSGRANGWLYEAALFTASLDGDYDFPDFDGGWAALGSIGYDYADSAGLDRAVVRLDYFHQDGDDRNNGVKPFRHVLSLNSTHQTGRFGLNTDLIYASGDGNVADVYGVVVMPYYDLLEKLRLVTRYTYAGGDGSSPLALASRYERPAVQDGSSIRGDNYHSVYGGLNYYLCGDKLKLMAGAEYATMGGDSRYSGITWLGGVRLDF